MLFSKFNLNGGEWLDLVFQDRNKSYGAFVIRRDADSYLFKALLISFGVFSLFIGSTVYYLNRDKEVSVIPTSLPDRQYDDKRVVKLEDFNQKEKPLIVAQDHPAKDLSENTVTQVNVAQVKYQEMRPVEDIKGIDAPDVATLQTHIIGPENIAGTKPESGNLTPGVINSTTANSGGKGEGSDNATYNMAVVEEMPAFPGGMDAWAKFLRKNLNYPAVAKEEGIQGRVTVSFVVEKDGSVTDIKVIKGIGGGCDEEAIRVIKKSPLWKAGVMNGRKVRVSYVIPIIFQMN
ncbi:energy transducer TonB [Pseudopedobacter beijingensis]|uniref:Energy transducer TonB n=1 Tax=Pseudopedobacter beijingensis TaxID=1207056 RepID=A0ABW4IH77_9SPHI